MPLALPVSNVTGNSALAEPVAHTAKGTFRVRRHTRSTLHFARLQASLSATGSASASAGRTLLALHWQSLLHPNS